MLSEPWRATGDQNPKPSGQEGKLVGQPPAHRARAGHSGLREGWGPRRELQLQSGGGHGALPTPTSLDHVEQFLLMANTSDSRDHNSSISPHHFKISGSMSECCDFLSLLFHAFFHFFLEISSTSI